MTIVAGVDVGSLYTKVILLRVDSLEGRPSIISHFTARSGAIYKTAAYEAYEDALKRAGLKREDISYIVSTGYGRYQVSFSDGEISEISCHARGAHFLFPEVHTLIDIGGQDSKVIRIDDRGGVADFMMNDKCAAGTGRFLEVMAQALDVDLSEMGRLSLLSKRELNVSSVCTVFAESEVISALSEGYDKVDIFAGIHRAIAGRMMGMAMRVRIKEKVAMSGGVAKNVGMVKALEKRMGTEILVADEPQTIGALGAALTAGQRALRTPKEARKFVP